MQFVSHCFQERLERELAAKRHHVDRLQSEYDNLEDKAEDELNPEERRELRRRVARLGVVVREAREEFEQLRLELAETHARISFSEQRSAEIELGRLDAKRPDRRERERDLLKILRLEQQKQRELELKQLAILREKIAIGRDNEG